mmetsp:Transcript_13922/g.36096  ORF Transcript_13922/g.36096 Transcript_13922/m.36096 type:complete len:384 (-) Transcript_13922:173-1324(-)
MLARTWGVTLASMSFTAGAVTDIFKKKLLAMGLLPVEVIAGWCTFDFLILTTVTTLFDPLPNLFTFDNTLWHSVLVSGAFSVTGSVMHALAIKKGGLVSVPFLSFNPAFSLLISSYLNKEFPSPQGMFGVFIVTVGALTLSYAMTLTAKRTAMNTPVRSIGGAGAGASGFLGAASGDDGQHGSNGERSRKHANGLGHEPDAYLSETPTKRLGGKASLKKDAQPTAAEARRASIIMTAVGFCWASASSIEKRALVSSHIQPAHFLMCQKLCMATPVLSYVLYIRLPQRGATKGDKREHPQHSGCFKRNSLVLLFISACLDAFTVLTYLLSLELIYVSFALALKRAGGVLLAVLGGRVLFKEVVTAEAWGAIMVMIVGVVLIVTS